MEENLNNKTESELFYIDTNKDSGISNSKTVEYERVTEQKHISKTAPYKKEDKSIENKKVGFVKRFYNCMKNNQSQDSKLLQKYTKETENQNKSGIIFSNTLSLLIISILLFILIYKSKLQSNFYKAKNVWILCILFLFSFYASATNFSLKTINNYRFSIYFNQMVLLLSSIALFYKLIKNRSNK